MEGTNESTSYFLGKRLSKKKKKEGKCIFEISLVIPPMMKLVSKRLWEKEVCLFWCASFFTILYQTIWYSFLRFVSNEALGVLSVCMYVNTSVCVYVCMNESTSVYTYILFCMYVYLCMILKNLKIDWTLDFYLKWCNFYSWFLIFIYYSKLWLGHLENCLKGGGRFLLRKRVMSDKGLGFF